MAADKERSELQLSTQLRQQEAAAAQEQAVLRQRADRLAKLQDAAIAAGGSTKARAMLYWESMKSKTRQQSSLSWRGEGEAAPFDLQQQQPAHQQADGLPADQAAVGT